MNSPAQRIAENLASIRERIAGAATRSGRSASDVRLVAVTKYVGPQEAAALVAAGCRDLGESRPQELAHKVEVLSSATPPLGEIRWHMIGHLQRNKARLLVPYVWLMQSCDSLRLLTRLQEEAAHAQLQLPVLLEVNISGDAAKYGFTPQEIEILLNEWTGYPQIEVRGLMAMASREGGQEQARRDFAALRNLRDKMSPLAESLNSVSLKELSMGMSGDFEAAIEEGATIVRVGSALFEGIER